MVTAILLAAALTAPPASPPRDALRISSDLAYVVLRPGGAGAHPRLDDDVTVVSHGWTGDGRPIDSPDLRGHPYTYHLRHLMLGWQEGVHMMTPGETIRIWMQPAVTHGKERGNERYYGKTMIFDIHLIAVKPHRGAESRPGTS